MKTFLRFLLPAVFSDFFLLRFGGDSGGSNSNSSTSNYSMATDNRLALGDGAIGASGGGSIGITDARDLSNTITDTRDMSTNFDVVDKSNRSSTDQSNRSINNSGNTTISSVDPGALRAMERALLTVDTTNKQAFSFGGDAFGFASDTAETFTNATLQQQDKVLDYLAKSDATRDAGFSKLLDVGTSLFKSNAAGLEKAQTLTAEAYRTATAEKSGSLDNRTITILGIALVAGFVLPRMFGRGRA